MAKQTKAKFTKTRNPVIVLICEGRNKTESKFFNHFIKRENPYNLKIIPSEATDPKSMAKKARHIIEEMQLDNKLGDRVFCKKYVPQYTESFDIVKECGLQNKYGIAINNSDLKNQMYDEEQCVLDKNPYTEISDLLDILLTYKNKE